MVSRVAGTIADWGRQRGYFASVEDGDTFEAELTHILLHQLAAFNSPVWFNVGFEEQPAVLGGKLFTRMVDRRAREGSRREVTTRRRHAIVASSTTAKVTA